LGQGFRDECVACISVITGFCRYAQRNELDLAPREPTATVGIRPPVSCTERLSRAHGLLQRPGPTHRVSRGARDPRTQQTQRWSARKNQRMTSLHSGADLAPVRRTNGTARSLRRTNQGLRSLGRLLLTNLGVGRSSYTSGVWNTLLPHPERATCTSGHLSVANHGSSGTGRRIAGSDLLVRASKALSLHLTR